VRGAIDVLFIAMIELADSAHRMAGIVGRDGDFADNFQGAGVARNFEAAGCKLRGCLGRSG